MVKDSSNYASEENYYNSESEGKEFDEEFWKEYNSQSKETNNKEKDNKTQA